MFKSAAQLFPSMLHQNSFNLTTNVIERNKRTTHRQSFSSIHECYEYKYFGVTIAKKQTENIK